MGKDHSITEIAICIILYYIRMFGYKRYNIQLMNLLVILSGLVAKKCLLAITIFYPQIFINWHNLGH